MRADVSTPSADLAQAVGALLLADPTRITALVSSLRAPGRSIESTVEGMSMGRSLPPGSRIRIQLIDRERYDAGCVIAFLAGKRVVVHRVMYRGIGAAASHVLTRGDAPLVPDPPVPHSQILGLVTGVWKDGHWMNLPDAPQRSLKARIASSFLLLVAKGLLNLSPRVTTDALLFLHRMERVLRRVRMRGSRQRRPLPPGAV